MTRNFLMELCSVILRECENHRLTVHVVVPGHSSVAWFLAEPVDAEQGYRYV